MKIAWRESYTGLHGANLTRPKTRWDFIALMFELHDAVQGVAIDHPDPDGVTRILVTTGEGAAMDAAVAIVLSDELAEHADALPMNLLVDVIPVSEQAQIVHTTYRQENP